MSTLALREVRRLCAAHRLDAQQPLPLYIDLSLLANHGTAQAPATLTEAVRLELARRGLPDETDAVLQAVGDGHCVLFLDHVESVEAYCPTVWQWPAELSGSGRARNRAHVVMICADEYFDDDGDVDDAARSLHACRASAETDVWFATLAPLDRQASRDACAAAGVDLATNPDLDRAWQWMTLEGRATLARLAALRPLFEQPRTQALQPLDVFKAWWTHCVPSSFGLEAQALNYIATALDLMRLQNPEQANTVSLEQFGVLVHHLWPQATEAQQTLLRMSLRIALQLQCDGSQVSVPSGLLWSGQAVIEALVAGDHELLGAAIAPGWRGTAAANAAVEAWQRAGHTAFPAELRTALQAEHPPAVAGALLRLSCQFARLLAIEQAHASAKAAGTPDVEARHRACLQEMLAPLSQARLAGAMLKGADLRDLPLTDLDLRRADLTGANFTGARLLRTVLDDAIADEASFERAVLHDVSAERFVARRSHWLHAHWNRRWTTAQLTQATPDMRPDTADAPTRLATVTGASPSSAQRLLRSAEGRWIAALLDDGGVAIWQGDTLAPVWHLPVADAGSKVLDAAFSHDGSHLITTHEHKALRRWTTSHGQLVQEYTDLHVPMALLVVHPGGGPVIAYGNHQRTGCTSELGRLGFLPATVPAGATQGLTCAALREPSGASVFSNDAQRGKGVVEYPSGAPRRVLDWPVDQAWQIATAHDAVAGHLWLAVLEGDALWLGNPDAATPPQRFERPGAVVATLKQRPGFRAELAPSGPMAQMAFSPDGRWLVCTGPGGPAIAIDTRRGEAHALDAGLAEGARCATFDAAGGLVVGGPGLRPCPLPD